MGLLNKGWRAVLPVIPGLLVGLFLGNRLSLIADGPVRPPEPALAQAPGTFAAEVPRARGYDANLYIQTAAEYRACCYQAYNLATQRLKELVGPAKSNGKKPAVVLDLDETVLDNAGFQAMMLRSGLTYDQRMWNMWESQYADSVALIPGAKEFIDEAKRLGVTVIYISNRSTTYRPSTEDALQRLGIAVSPENLKLSSGPTDKSDRREEARKAYNVLLYLGDNLRDFDEEFRFTVDNTKPETLDAAIRDRKAKVDRRRDKWGTEWIILPNPVYGEWTKPLGLGEKDLDRLVPVRKTP